MKTLCFVDVSNIFYGLKRLVGSPHARFDFVKLRGVLQTSGQDAFLAYISTPVTGKVSSIELNDAGRFHGFLRRVGYTVHKVFNRAYMEPGDEVVQFSKPYIGERMLKDAVGLVDLFDRVVIVSGSGAMIGLADLVKSKKKRLVVACFERAGDLNTELRHRADEIIGLDATYRYTAPPTIWRTER